MGASHLKCKRAISDIAHLLHGRRTHWRALALLQAFFDESGTHGYSRTVVIAGYVATEPEWDKVQKRWDEVLKRHGLKEFHATDFFAGDGKFSSMNVEERESLITGLVGVIRYGELHAITVSADAHAYSMVTTPKFRNIFPKAYDLCFNDIIRGIDLWSKLNADGEEVGLVFSSTNEYDDRNRETFANWKRYRHLNTIGGLQFNFPSKAPALQCADLLANRLYRSWDSLQLGQSGDGKLIVDHVLENISVGENDSGFLNEAAIRLRVANANWRDPCFPCPMEQQPSGA